MNLLSILIVNYRSAALAVDAIRSVKQCNPLLSCEIIVIDNASGDESKTIITHSFPDVQWIDMGYNAGFARANNAGMRAARGDAFLLLNPDTLAVDDAITQCYRQLMDSKYAAAGVQLFDAHGEPQLSGHAFVKGGLNHLLPLPYWGNFVRWIAYRAGSKAPGVQAAKRVEEVDWISGAFLMVKRAATEGAGLMDEDFFLYAEEVEWCSRLRRRGALCLFGHLRIVHLEGGSINTSQGIEQKGYYNLFDKKGLQLMVSNHLRVRKQYGVFWFLFLLLNYTWGVVVFFVGSFLHRLFTLRNPFGDWKQAAAFAGNVGRLWTLAPKIIAGKPHFYKMF